MSKPDFSIVIPTFERMDVLPEVLEAVDDQDTGAAFEVVVVDDGSRDGTASFLRSWRAVHPFRVLRQENRGPAAARNAGVAAARGRRVAFLGDDTVPASDWLAAHDRTREEDPGTGPVAVLGYTRWHPRIRRTRFLEFINEEGLQFGYGLIDDPEDVPFNFFYTSNISLPRALLLEEPLDEGFPYPAWEDTELAYRLTRRLGLRIVYEPKAVTLHDHPTDFDRFCDRQEKAGYSAVVFYRLHPELGDFLGIGNGGPPPVPSRVPQVLRELLVRALQSFPVSLPRIWQEALRYHYILGLRRGWRELGGAKA
ncbi:MAG: glycosyltransferase [Thermoanaerobaculia bacterium]|nr:glycosyltransferase [Thermoanaerobaculia bacterium]